jgi:hypothetical protein
MKRLYIGTLMSASLLTLSANAQYGPPPGEGRYYERGRGDLFGRVRADLDRAESGYYSSGGDRHRFNKVREEMAEFQRTGSPHELNDAIGSLQKVVNDNRMPYRDRDMLAADLSALREFRARNGWR